MPSSPTDTIALTIALANALAAAELKAAAEDARRRPDTDPDQLVRLENLAHRAERRLGIRRRSTARPLPPDPHETGRGVGLADLVGDPRD